jgi:molybdate transport system ATP-binding protein
LSAAQALHARVVRRVHEGLRLDVALALGPECGVVFGRSGAGKTTLLRLIAGLETPDAGRISLWDEVIFDAEAGTNRPLRERRVGMIFQDDLLFPHLSAGGNIRYGLKGWPKRQADDRLAEVAALCGVEALLGRRPATLSGGERQRVGLARALAPRPRLLLCDEPVSALDLASRHALIDRLRAVQRAEAIPVLYVTHSPAEAIALGTRLFLLSQGRVADQGAPLDVLTGPASGAVARLEGVRNVLPAVVEGHAPGGGETLLRLVDGPLLVVPYNGRVPGSRLTVEVRADDVLLARGPVEGLSARNVIEGSVERVAGHGPEAEVVVRSGGVSWIVSVVAPAVEALELRPGQRVHMIIKARSCHIIGGDEASDTAPAFQV